jgi:hypothetical protein
MFGDKKTLFDEALERNTQVIATNALARFEAEPDIMKAVDAFIDASIVLRDKRRRWYLACAAAAGGERLSAVTDAVSHRFEAEAIAGRLRGSVSSRGRALMLVDLMQGMAVRARSGASKEATSRKFAMLSGPHCRLNFEWFCSRDSGVHRRV